MAKYEVYRNRKYLGTYEAKTSNQAVNEALDDWLYKKFGNKGIVTSNDASVQGKFFDAKFKAVETRQT